MSDYPTGTLPLFDNPQMPSKAESKKASLETRNEAHKKQPKRLDTEAHLRLLAFVRERGSYGATRAEVANALGMKLSTVCGRANELLNNEESGIFQVPGRRRGGSAIMFVKGFA